MGGPVHTLSTTLCPFYCQKNTLFLPGKGLCVMASQGFWALAPSFGVLGFLGVLVVEAKGLQQQQQRAASRQSESGYRVCLVDLMARIDVHCSVQRLAAECTECNPLKDWARVECAGAMLEAAAKAGIGHRVQPIVKLRKGGVRPYLPSSLSEAAGKASIWHGLVEEANASSNTHTWRSAGHALGLGWFLRQTWERRALWVRRRQR